MRNVQRNGLCDSTAGMSRVVTSDPTKNYMVSLLFETSLFSFFSKKYCLPFLLEKI